MKCFKGFVTTKDPETKKEVPFFVKVRSKDIVVTTPIKIDDYLYKTSNDYTLESEYHGHDYSQYVFKNLNDNTIGGGTRVVYKLFRDGTMRIDGQSSVSKFTKLTNDAAGSEGYYVFSVADEDRFYRIQLPYSISPKVSLSSNNWFHNRNKPVYSVSCMYDLQVPGHMTNKPAYILLYSNKPIDPNISATITKDILSQLLVYADTPTEITSANVILHYSLTSQFTDSPIAY